MGYPKKCHNLCANGGPVKSRDIPRNIYGDLLSDVTRSVTGFGRKSGNRHFAKRISPHKDLSLINIIYPLPIEVESISFTGENC